MPVDMFMKMKGERQGDITGESRDKKHAGEIDVLGWQWGLTSPTDSSSGMATGKIQFQHFTFKKFLEKSSNRLMTAAINNENITKATLTCRRVGIAGSEPVEFLTITFENARVVRLSRVEEAGDVNLFEEVTIAFQKFTENYEERTIEGKVGDKLSTSWSISENR